MPPVKVTINGTVYEVDPKDTVLQASQKAGFFVPTYCYHPKLTLAGACRMCLVEIEGARGPAASCVTPVRDGMVVRTESPVVAKDRAAVLEFLLLQHPLDCPVCDKGGDCRLQEFAFKYGPYKSQVDFERREFEPQNLGDYIASAMNRCIVCKRCVRTCDEVVGEKALGVFERGGRSFISTVDEQPLGCVQCGNCIEVCPVGALLPKPDRFTYRPWQVRTVTSTCGYCPVGCKVSVWDKEGWPVRVNSGEPAGGDEWLCVKGRFGYALASRPERLASPMVRKDGRLVEVGWDEALDRAVDLLKKAGAAAQVLGGGHLTQEENGLLKALAGKLSTPHLDSRLDRTWASAAEALLEAAGDAASFGSVSWTDAKTVLVAGSDPKHEAPVLGMVLRQRSVSRQAQVAVLAERVTVLHEVSALKETLPPGGLEARLEALAQNLEKGASEPVADLLMKGEKVLLVAGRRLGYAGASALARIYSALKKAGKAPGLALTGGRANSLGALSLGLTPGEGGLPAWSSSAGWREGKLKAGIWFGVDPKSSPDLDWEAAPAPSGLVVVDLFPTAATETAEVVLPACSWLEKKGTMLDAGGRAKTLESSLQSPGEARTDGEILSELLSRLGADPAAAVPAASWKASSSPARIQGKAPSSKEKSLLLVDGERFNQAGSSSAHVPLLKFEQDGRLVLSPEDMSKLGLKRGGSVSVQCEAGNMKLQVEADPSQPQGSVWHSAGPGPKLNRALQASGGVLSVTLSPA